MSFKLHFAFTGLCMFVPDPAGEQMHVLLADADHHAGHLGGKHYARLFYDEGYEQPGGVLTGDWEEIKLDKRALLVPRFGRGADQALPKQIVSLQPIAGNLPRAQILNQPSRVKARVTLGSGKITWCAPGAYWQLRERKCCMTNIVVWTMDVPQESIELPLARLNNGSKGWLEELFPINGHLVLWVANAMKDDMPNSDQAWGEPEKEAKHFSAYYDLYTSNPTPVNPVLLNEVGNCPAGSEDPFGPDFPWPTDPLLEPERYQGADPHRCMVSGGTLG